MLARTLEPEVMDSREDAWDYDSMDHAEVNRRFVDDLLAARLAGGTESPRATRDCQWLGLSGAKAESEPPSGRGDAALDKADLTGDVLADDDRPPLLMLDLGTGTAQIPILLCQATEDVRIIAADAAVSMLDLARLNVEISGLRERIQLDHSDAKQMPYRASMFDAVISNSIVHHIPEPREVLREAVRVTKPGGLLFFRDLKRPAGEDELGQLVESYAAGCNEHQQTLFRDSLHAALTLEEMQALVAELGFATATVQVTSDRHWTWSARKPV